MSFSFLPVGSPPVGGGEAAGDVAAGDAAGVAAGTAGVPVGTGVRDFEGAATGQLTTDVSVYTGCAATVVETIGAEAAVADESVAAPAWPGPAPCPAVGVHLVPLDDFGAGEAPGAVPGLAPPPAGETLGAAGAPAPPAAGRCPLPSVLSVARCGALPPCSTVLAWRMACRNG